MFLERLDALLLGAECIVQSQRVIYAIDDEREIVTILALVHVRQDLAGREGKPWE